MAIKVYRIRLEGYVVAQDFGGSSPEVTPADWGPDQILEAMGADIEVTETLVDTIRSEEPVSMRPLEEAIDMLYCLDVVDDENASAKVDRVREHICQYHNEMTAKERGDATC